MMTHLAPDQLQKYFAALQKNNITSYPHSTLYFMDTLFRGIDFTGKIVLDIGAGRGMFSTYMALAGARQVIALEPEAGGYIQDTLQHFYDLATSLGVDDMISINHQTIQQYDPGTTQFDVIILIGSINHLDEEACIQLHTSQQAQESYLQIFQKLSAMAKRGATLIISDCERRNLFGYLGWQNPFTSDIHEWHKHQSPHLWSQLLSQAGFGQAQIKWRPIYRFPAIIRPFTEFFFDNHVTAYLTTSRFVLSMQKL